MEVILTITEQSTAAAAAALERAALAIRAQADDQDAAGNIIGKGGAAIGAWEIRGATRDSALIALGEYLSEKAAPPGSPAAAAADAWRSLGIEAARTEAEAVLDNDGTLVGWIITGFAGDGTAAAVANVLADGTVDDYGEA